LRALAAELNVTEQRERQRLAADLHDYLGQLLALTRMKLSQAKRQPMEAVLGTMLEEILEVTDKALSYTRTLVAQLSPPVLQEFGLTMALQWLAEQMRQRDLLVSVEFNTEMPSLPQDQALLLFQSVRELLINCVKHAAAHDAAITVDRTNGLFRITVTDYGSGFDSAALGSKSHDATSGFGLFSIRERMLSLGGRLDIASAPGKGTVAQLLLPMPPAAEDVSPVDEQSAHGEETKDFTKLQVPELHKADDFSANGSKMRIVVADDHAIVRQGLCGLLGQYCGIEVVGEAANGEEAVALADALRPDVVLMDVTMPKMDGIEATGILKRRHPSILVIGLSLHTAEQVQAAMIAAGATAFINKEAAVDELRQTIHAAKMSTS
jgi:CheY-like chemotaxis protein